jgi:hypothetical protein
MGLLPHPQKITSRRSKVTACLARAAVRRFAFAAKRIEDASEHSQTREASTRREGAFLAGTPILQKAREGRDSGNAMRQRDSGISEEEEEKKGEPSREEPGKRVRT